MDPRLGLLLDMGEALLEAGAETARAEETILRAGQALGHSSVDALVTPSGIWLSVASPDGAVTTVVRRVRRRGLLLWRLVALNDLSRALAAGSVDLDAARARLDAVLAAPPPYPAGVATLSGGLAAAGYAGLIGATGAETLAAFVLGLAATALRRGVRGHFADRFLGGVAGGFAAGLLGSCGRLAPAWGLRPEVLIPAGIVVLVPGLQLTNALRDVLHGDLLSAASLGLEALVLALGIAGGVAAGIGLVIWGRSVV